MATFTPEDVRRLASLARLELSDEEIGAFARQLGDILDFARQVQSADATSLATPSAPRIDAAVLPPLEPTRVDVVQPSLPRDRVLASAPDANADARLFKVPRVLDA